MVIEPLTGETLWRKTVQIEPNQTAVPQQEGPVCQPGPPPGAMMPPGAQPPTSGADEPSPEGDVGNAYRRALEAVFVATMKGIDTYMNVEEFEMLKQQSQELREKKVF